MFDLVNRFYKYNYTSDSSTETELTENETDLTENETEIKTFRIKYTSKKKNMKGCGVQSELTLEEIKEQLKGYTKLSTLEEKKLISKLPIFRTHVRYVNHKLNKYRMGGLLLKSNYPDNIILINTVNNYKWTVKLDDITLFVKDTIINEEVKKNKLYELYKEGKLTSSNEKVIYKKYKTSKTKEQRNKDKLYNMYVNKQLKLT